MPWTDGLTAEEIGHAQTRGWDKLDPEAAAREGVKAHRSAHVKLGIEPDRVLRIPDKDDAAGWGNVHKALGVPETADKYTFDGVDDATKTVLQATAHALRLPPGVAPKLLEQYTNWNKTVSETVKAEQTARETAANTEKATKEITVKAANTGALEAEWNPAGGYDANHQRAVRAATALGYTAEEITALSATDKYVPFMRRMLSIDKAGGEAPMHGLGAGGGTGGEPPETEEQLSDRKAKIFATKVVGKILKPEDQAAIAAELAEIDRKIVLSRHSRRPA